MKYSLVVQAEAVLEMRDAYDWYEYKRKGLGDDLMEEIEVAYEKLFAHPLHYRAINKNFRRLKINRFPYLMVYEIAQQEIIIIAFRHTKQKSRF